MADLTPADDRREPARPPHAAPVTPRAPSRWTGGRIAMLVAGSVLALIALGAIAAGVYGLWLHTTQRSDGYVMSSSERFHTGGYALATRTLQISSDVPRFLYGRDWLGDVRIRGESTDPSRPLFIGIARNDDVERYLAGVAHSEVLHVNANPFGTSYRPSYRDRPGGKPASAPVLASFRVARVAGPGSQALTCSVKQGRWAVVVMRPDGSAREARPPTSTVIISAGVASCPPLSLRLDNGTVVVGEPSSNGYFTASNSDRVVLIVYQPATDKFAAGGGWVTDPSANVSTQNQHGNFGLTVRYKSGTTTPQGQAVCVFRGTDTYDCVIKSNNWTGGDLSFGTNIGSFSGKASVTAIDPRTGLAVSGFGGGNYTYGGSTSPTTAVPATRIRLACTRLRHALPPGWNDKQPAAAGRRQHRRPHAVARSRFRRNPRRQSGHAGAVGAQRATIVQVDRLTRRARDR